MSVTLIIDGNKFRNIKEFYEEVNCVFMQDEDWRIGESLDAFNDLLFGGFGAAGPGPLVLIWRDMEKSCADLGMQATRDYYRAKLARPEQFNAARFQAELAALEAGTGQTYFDILLEIIADHPQITLVPA